jgi:hypothetical protein
MAEQRPNAPDERVLGAVAIEPADLQCAGVEATAGSQIYEASQWCALAFALVGAALNFRDASSTGSRVFSCVMIPVLIFAIIAGRRQRAQRANTVRKRITAVQGGEAPVIQYDLGPSRFEIQSGSNSVRYAWSACQGFDEERHTFLLYFDRAVPDVLFKRAFRVEDLPRVRDLLGSCVKTRMPLGKRARLRSLLLALVLGFALIGIGIVAAVFSR